MIFPHGWFFSQASGKHHLIPEAFSVRFATYRAQVWRVAFPKEAEKRCCVFVAYPVAV